MKVSIEIRAGEGGDDAKLLVDDLAAIYANYAKRTGAKLDLEDESLSQITLAIEGERTIVAPLLKEAGGHRFQRVPPTERSGRVHTSTVTVAVLQLKEPTEFKLREQDIDVFTTKDTGPGGQNRNKTESAVIMRHKPTGIEAKSALKSQHQNRRMARQVLEARVAEHFANIEAKKVAGSRKAQVGSGMRGDKIRTYRTRDNQVTDHLTGKKCRLSDIREGRLELLR